MVPDVLTQLADKAIQDIGSGQVTDERIQALRHFFPDTLIVAAFDLVDRGCVIKYSAPWGRTLTQVVGSSGRYLIHASPTPHAFCPCPAFTYGALLASSHSLCKHILAVRLAEGLDKCDQRLVSLPDFLAVAVSGSKSISS